MNKADDVPERSQMRMVLQKNDQGNKHMIAPAYT